MNEYGISIYTGLSGTEINTSPQSVIPMKMLHLEDIGRVDEDSSKTITITLDTDVENVRAVYFLPYDARLSPRVGTRMDYEAYVDDEQSSGQTLVVTAVCGIGPNTAIDLYVSGYILVMGD